MDLLPPRAEAVELALETFAAPPPSAAAGGSDGSGGSGGTAEAAEAATAAAAAGAVDANKAVIKRACASVFTNIDHGKAERADGKRATDGRIGQVSYAAGGAWRAAGIFSPPPPACPLGRDRRSPPPSSLASLSRPTPPK
jgi:hypothetical protein